MIKNQLLAIPLIALITACAQPEKKTEKRDILAENMDTTVNPAHDFFKFANGGWISKNPIPESERSFGIAKLVMNETYDRMKKLSEEAAADSKAPKGSSTQKIGDFYHTGMDTVTSNAQRYSKLQPELDRIAKVTDRKGL